MIEPKHTELSIVRQCGLLNLPRATYYRNTDWAAESAENLNFMHLIDEEYTRHPFYGTRKMRDHLRRNGYQVNRKRIQRLMRKMGLKSVAPGPNIPANLSLRTRYTPICSTACRSIELTRFGVLTSPTSAWPVDLSIWLRSWTGIAVKFLLGRSLRAWKIASVSAPWNERYDFTRSRTFSIQIKGRNLPARVLPTF